MSIEMATQSVNEQLDLNNLVLVDSWLVEVVEESEAMTSTGLYVLKFSQELNNMGTVVKTPRYLTVSQDKHHISLPSNQISSVSPWTHISVGDIIFFPGNLSYPVLEHRPNGALILVSSQQILGFYKTEKGGNK